MLFRRLSMMFPSSPLAALAIIGFLTEVILHWHHENSFVHNSDITFVGHLHLLCFLFSTWCTAVWCSHWLTLLQHTSRRYQVVLGIVSLVTGVGTAAYIASWCVFYHVSSFVTFDSVLFCLHNYTMLFEYSKQVESLSVAGCLLLSLIVGISVAVCLFRIRPTPSSYGGICEPMGLVWVFLAINSAMMPLLFTDGQYHASDKAKAWTSRSWNEVRYTFNHALNPIAAITFSFTTNSAYSEYHFSPSDCGEARAIGDKLNRAPPSHNHRPRSIVFIIVESLRSDVIGQAHNEIEVMPTLNAIASNGVNFSTTYSNSTHSDYSDPSIVSSLYPLRSPQHHYYSRTDSWPKYLFYDVLADAGYSSALFSSQNETWGRMDAFLESNKLEVFFDSRAYHGPTLSSELDRGFSTFVTRAKVAGKLDDAITVDHAIEWLQHRNTEKPFCLYLNLQTSHFPYQLPVGAGEPFKPATIDFPMSFAGYPPDKAPILRNAYFNSLRYIDDQLLRLIAYLKAEDVLDETLLVIMGDHGECFYESGHPTHAGPPVEFAIRPGFVMHCPDLLAARNETYPTQLIDTVPTALALLGMPPHPGFQGINVLSDERPTPDKRLMFVHCHCPLSSTDAIITNSGWKLVRDRQRQRSNLYYIPKDPTESSDCSYGHPRIVALLEKQLDSLAQRQLTYYGNTAINSLYYPPKLSDLTDDEVATLNEIAQ